MKCRGEDLVGDWGVGSQAPQLARTLVPIQCASADIPIVDPKPGRPLGEQEALLEVCLGIGHGLGVVHIELIPGFFQGLIEDLQLAAPLMQLDQDRDLAAQDLRHDRDGDVVDGPDLVALQPIEIGHVHPRGKDDRGALQAGMLADQSGQLKAVHAWHIHVQHDHRECFLEEPVQCFGARKGSYTTHVETREDSFVRKQAGRLVIDEQNTGGHGHIVHERRVPPVMLGFVRKEDQHITCRNEPEESYD